MKNDQNLANIRQEYKKSSLDESVVPSDPVILFTEWMATAIKEGIPDPTAMTLSTVSAEGFPSSRIVLLKEVTPEGFQFFTNYNSRKGRELEVNPQAALLFFWPFLEQQIRIEGKVKKLSDEISDAYFSSRPAGSQTGAWISPQSETIPNRLWLDQKSKEFEFQYQEKKVSRPSYWGGYALQPCRIEFWQGRENRLHDRILYEEKNGYWKISRLAP